MVSPPNITGSHTPLYHMVYIYIITTGTILHCIYMGVYRMFLIITFPNTQTVILNWGMALEHLIQFDQH